MMKKLLLFLLCALLLCGPLEGVGESASAVSFQYRDDRAGRSYAYSITRPDLLDRIRKEMETAQPCAAPEGENRFVRVLFELDGQACAVCYDSVFSQSYLLRGGDWFLLPNDLGAALCYPALLWLGEDAQPDFQVNPSYTAYLAEYGWTPFFTLAETEITLPERLTAQSAEEANLYFTWADLFLRASGCDLTPWLGKRVNVTILGLWEKMERSRFFSPDLVSGFHIPMNLRCVLLRDGDAILGGFLAPGRHNGSWMASLNGETALDLLGTDDPTGYLLSRAALTEQEEALASQTPEEIISQFFLTPPEENSAFLLRRELLDDLAANAQDDWLFVTRSQQLSMQRAWMGESGAEDWQPAAVQEITLLDPDSRIYQAVTENREKWQVQLAYESPETGWKVKSWYR